MKSLNANEVDVLKMVANEIMDCTEGEFGYSENILHCRSRFSNNQIKGYLGQLTQKGYISIDDEHDGQIFLRESAGEFVNKIESYETV